MGSSVQASVRTCVRDVVSIRLPCRERNNDGALSCTLARALSSSRVLVTFEPPVSRGAPPNEFESEAETILLGLRGRSLRHVDQVIDEEFIHWFGASMRLRPEQQRRIARGLLDLLPARLRLSGNFLHRYGPASGNPASGRTVHVRAQPMN